MRFMLLYSDTNGKPSCLIAHDTEGTNLPSGAGEFLAIHGEDFNDGGSVFVVELSDDADVDPIVMDEDGAEIGRDFVTI